MEQGRSEGFERPFGMESDLRKDLGEIAHKPIAQVDPSFSAAHQQEWPRRPFLAYIIFYPGANYPPGKEIGRLLWPNNMLLAGNEFLPTVELFIIHYGFARLHPKHFLLADITPKHVGRNPRSLLKSPFGNVVPLFLLLCTFHDCLFSFFSSQPFFRKPICVSGIK